MNLDSALAARFFQQTIPAVVVLVLVGMNTDVVAQLPEVIELDRHWFRAQRLVNEKDYLGALDALNSLESAKESSNLPLPGAFHFVRARAALSAGKLKCARDAVERYLTETGRFGNHYKEALKLLDDAKLAVPEMVKIPNGHFSMGCLSGDRCDDNQKSARCVSADSFEISKYEVTFEQYDRFVAATGHARPGDNGWGRGRRPVIRVSWHDAVAYTKWLSAVTGDCYSLPTEAQWLYAAGVDSIRCGSRSESGSKRIAGNQTCTGDSNRVGYNGPRKATKTAPVGSFEVNPCGLHDMHGNVSEWVLDCRSERCNGVTENAKAPNSCDCSRRVSRGGSWKSGLGLHRLVKPTGESKEEKSSEIGFRVVRSTSSRCENKHSTCTGQTAHPCEVFYGRPSQVGCIWTDWLASLYPMEYFKAETRETTYAKAKIRIEPHGMPYSRTCVSAHHRIQYGGATALCSLRFI